MTPEEQAALEAQQRKELQDAVNLAEELRTGQRQFGEGDDPAAFFASAEDARLKLRLADEIDVARAEGMKDDDPAIVQAKALVYGNTSAFVDLTKGTVDVSGAVRAGLSAEQLRTLGIDQETANRVRQGLQTERQQVAVNAAAAKEFRDWQDKLKAEHPEVYADWLQRGDVAIDDYNKQAAVPGSQVTVSTVGLSTPGIGLLRYQMEQMPQAPKTTTIPKAKIKATDYYFDQNTGLLVPLNERAETFTKEYNQALVQANVRMIPVLGTVVTWNQMTPAERGVSVALDVVSIGAPIAVFKGVSAIGRAVKMRGVVSAARVAGKDYETMQLSLKRLPLGSVERSVQAETAITKSLAADRAFLNKLSTLKTISPKELSKLENATKLKGLKSSIVEVNKAQAKYDRALDAAQEYQLRAKLTTNQRITQMLNNTQLEKARAELTASLGKLDEVTKTRYVSGTPTEFKGYSFKAGAKKTRIVVLEGLPGEEPSRGGLKLKTKTAAKVKVDTFVEGRLKAEYAPTKTAPKQKVTIPKLQGKELLKTLVAPRMNTKQAARVLDQISQSYLNRMTIAQAQRLYGTDNLVDAVSKTTLASITGSKQMLAIKPAISNSVQSLSNVGINAYNEAKQSGATEAQAKAKVKPAIKESIKTTIQTTTKSSIPIDAGRGGHGRLGLPLPITKESETANITANITAPEGSVTWKQGIGWWTRYPPFRSMKDSFFTMYPPKGAEVVADAKTAAATIQDINGTVSHKLPDFPMGVMTVETARVPAHPGRTNQDAMRFVNTRSIQSVKRAKSKRFGPYYIAGGAISRRPIG